MNSEARTDTITDPPALHLTEVTKRYGEVVAVHEVSLSVPRGLCLAIVGESGSGKSTMLRMFNRLVTPDSGRVSRDGVPLTGQPPESIRRSTGYVPQEGGLLPHWTVLRNAATVPWLLGQADAEDRATRALESVGLDRATFSDRWPAQLSGGQRQRVALARALAHEPEILLLDEPFGALDALTRIEVQATLRALLETLSLTAVLVTHDLREACLLGDRVAVMHVGGIEQVDTPERVRSNPETEYVRTLFERVGDLG